MPNLSVSSVTQSGGNTVLKGKSTSGATITVKSGSTTLGMVTANANGDWEITFPTASNGSIKVSGAGKEQLVAVIGAEDVAITDELGAASTLPVQRVSPCQST